MGPVLPTDISESPSASQLSNKVSHPLLVSVSGLSRVPGPGQRAAAFRVKFTVITGLKQAGGANSVV